MYKIIATFFVNKSKFFERFASRDGSGSFVESFTRYETFRKITTGSLGLIMILAVAAFGIVFNQERNLNIRIEFARTLVERDSEKLQSGSLISTPTVQAQEQQKALAVTLAEVDIQGKAEGDELSLAETLTALISVTTTEEDVETLFIESVFHENHQEIAGALLADEYVLENIRESVPEAQLEAAKEEIKRAFAVRDVQYELAKDIEDKTIVEKALDQAITEDTKQLLLTALAGSVYGNMYDMNIADDYVSTLLETEVRLEVISAITQAIIQKYQDEPTYHATLKKFVDNPPEMFVPETGKILTVEAAYHDGTKVDLELSEVKFEAGSIIMLIESAGNLRPGLYSLDIHLNNPLTHRAEVLSQDFAWGVLSMNADKDVYVPGDTGQIHFGVLNNEGEPLCDARLFLSVKTPAGVTRDISTENGLIRVSETCGKLDPGFIKPDYQTEFTFNDEGTHVFSLRAETLSGVRTYTQGIQVTNDPGFVVRRRSATRIYPYGDTPMTIDVSFYEDFIGDVVEIVPNSFDISRIGPMGRVTRAQDERPGMSELSPWPDTFDTFGLRQYKTITWSGAWQAGDTTSFRYSYDAPDVSPEFYMVGPMQLLPKPEDGETPQLKKRMERRAWRIASDATCYWTGAVDGTWNTAGNWSGCGGNVPGVGAGAGDDVVFDGGTSNVNVTLNTHVDLHKVTIEADYAGTVNAGGYTLNVSGDWTNEGAHFAPGTSTVILDGANQTIWGTTTFNNLSKANASNTLTFEDSLTQKVSGTLTLSGTSAANRLKIRSTIGASQAYINTIGGSVTASNVDIKDNYLIRGNHNEVDPSGSNNSGNTQLWFTPVNLSNGKISSVVELDAETNGPTLSAGDNYGVNIANIGDLDKDGVVDIAVGALNDDAGGTDYGTVHLHFMNSDGSIKGTTEINQTTTPALGLDSGEQFGAAVASLGDLNNDGIQELAVGAQNEAPSGTGSMYILFMNTNGTVKSNPSPLKIDSGTNLHGPPNLPTSGQYGNAIANIGDIDGNGMQDVAVGSPRYESAACSRDCGAVYVHMLERSGSTVSIKSTKLHDKLDFSTTQAGPSAINSYGLGIAAMGDLNGDGIQDVIGTAPGRDRTADNPGAFYIYYMDVNCGGSDLTCYKKTIGPLTDTDLNPFFTTNIDADDYFGRSAAGIGDLNNDGINDVAISSAQNWQDAQDVNDTGRAAVLFLDYGYKVSGTVFTDEGTTNIGADKAVEILVNGVSAGSAETDSDGAYSLSHVNYSAGDVITAYLQDETEDGATVTVGKGAPEDVAQFDMYKDYLIARHENAGPITNANITDGHDGDADLTAIYADSGNAVLTTQLDKSLLVWTDKTYKPGGQISAGGSIYINDGSTLDTESNAVAVDGNFQVRTGGAYLCNKTGETTCTLTFDRVTDCENPDPAVGRQVIADTAGTTTFGTIVHKNTCRAVVQITDIETNYLKVNPDAAGDHEGAYNLGGYNLTVNNTVTNNAAISLHGNEAVSLASGNDVNSGAWMYIGDDDGTADEIFTIKDFGAIDYYDVWIADDHATKDAFTIASALTVADNFRVKDGTFEGPTSPSPHTLSAANMIIEGGTCNMGDADLTTTSAFVQSSGSFSQQDSIINIGGNLNQLGGTFVGSSSATGATIDIGGDFHQTGGDFYANDNSFHVEGGFLRGGSTGTFTANPAGEVRFNGADHTVTGSSTFQDLSFISDDDGTSDSVTFENGTTQTVEGTLTIDGNPGDVMYMLTDSAGSRARIDMSGAPSALDGAMDYLDVKDHEIYNVSGATTSLPINPTTSTDSGNTENWFDEPPVISATTSLAARPGSGDITDLDLIAGSTKKVYVFGTITDNDGCEDIGDVYVSLYESASGSEKTDNAQHSYVSSVTPVSPANHSGCTPGTDLDATFDVEFDVQYYALATDLSADPGSTRYWQTKVEATDRSDSLVGTSSLTWEMNSLNAFEFTTTEVDDSLRYGSFPPGTVSTGFTGTFGNLGNRSINMEQLVIDADPPNNEYDLVCSGSGEIPAEDARMDLDNGVSFDYNTEWDHQLSGTEAVPVDIIFSGGGLSASTDGTSATVDAYFKIKIPLGSISVGMCSNTLRFTSVLQ